MNIKEETNNIKYLEMEGISMKFGNFYALKNVTLWSSKGEVVAICGENGAGKSTLMKILAGTYQPSGGEIRINNQLKRFNKPKDAIDASISLIYQEINLCRNMSVAENIYMGGELTNSLFILDRESMYQESQKILNFLGARFKSSTLVSRLSIGDQQLVEIARALHRNSKILIFDEPTSSLSSREVEALFKVIKKLRTEGISILYISHRMDEIMKLADRVVVLRDGESVGDLSGEQIIVEDIIKKMIGRELGGFYFKTSDKNIGEKVLELKELRDNAGKVKGVNLNVCKGEVVGISGLVGSGRSEIAHLIFGSTKKASGEIIISNQVKKIKNPKDAINSGIAFITEDRRDEGLFLNMMIKENIGMPTFDRYAKAFGINNNKHSYEMTERYIKELKMRVAKSKIQAKNLSGGTQQKLLFARWMLSAPDILILDEPTRGVDVGTKKEIYEKIDQLALKGVAILVISSELSEIMGITDRLYVMAGGEMTAELITSETSQEEVMSYATGGSK